MDENQLTHNTDSSFFFNRFPAFPELSRLSPSASSSLSSVTGWDELKSDIEEDHVVNNNVDVVEIMNCMDFMDSITWDDHDTDVSNYEITSDFQHKDHDIDVTDYEITSDFQHKEKQSTVKTKRKGSKDLALIFLEWLKSNKGVFSAEDLRKVKLNRSTIESSIQRFGGGKEGMKRLLELILEWVQKHHIHQGKRMRTLEEPFHLPIKPNPGAYPNFSAQSRTSDPNGKNIIAHAQPDHGPCFSISNWNNTHLTLPQPPQLSPYAGDSTKTTAGTTSESLVDIKDTYQQHTGDHSWSLSQSAMLFCTKEAKRTGMAREKRVLPGHKHNQFENYHHTPQSGSTRENCITSPATASEESEDDPGNQVYWP